MIHKGLQIRHVARILRSPYISSRISLDYSKDENRRKNLPKGPCPHGCPSHLPHSLCTQNVSPRRAGFLYTRQIITIDHIVSNSGRTARPARHKQGGQAAPMARPECAT